MQIEIRQLQDSDIRKALCLSLETFVECGKADYDESGLEEFKSFIHDEAKIGALIFLGAFDGDRLIGNLAFRGKDNHISLFFIRPAYHRKGIGRRLFDAMVEGYDIREITVNSSTYAVPFYESLGFRKLSEARNCNGIISVPMRKMPEIEIRTGLHAEKTFHTLRN